MLLELDVNSLRSLLVNKEALSVAIDKAKYEYEKQLEGNHERKMTLPDDVAERLYEAVTEVYEKNAAKITGSWVHDINPLLQWHVYVL